jgi:hypothetical protein
VRAVGRAEHGQGRLRGRDAQGGTGGDDHAVVGLDHQRRGTFGFDAQFALHHHQGFLVREAGDVEAAFETQAACAHAADALPGNFAHGGGGRRRPARPDGMGWIRGAGGTVQHQRCSHFFSCFLGDGQDCETDSTVLLRSCPNLCFMAGAGADSMLSMTMLRAAPDPVINAQRIQH